jgi:hypothetical protein
LIGKPLERTGNPWKRSGKPLERTVDPLADTGNALERMGNALERLGNVLERIPFVCGRKELSSIVFNLKLGTWNLKPSFGIIDIISNKGRSKNHVYDSRKIYGYGRG